MEINIVDHELPNDSHNYYDVYFYDDRVNTLVTHDPDVLSNWLFRLQKIHGQRLGNLIVGLDVEWRPNFNRNQDNPIATLQLCVGRRCVVFQILHCSRECQIPDDLKYFLAEPDFTFVGVGIAGDVEKLAYDYGLSVGGRIVDLRDLAADRYGNKAFKNVGLKDLASAVLGRVVEKPKSVTMGRWDNRWLTPLQVQYACVDAFASFEIGRSLEADDY
ncbi:OLC1v1036262C1 [Oldenlandia corymbosa var. corymbosa]|uniref:OLC1v1036262C1 n=1 Tax=Oldenlandia corymbosa var. corymbosa TaxID=529605 RepID=A0AAV1CVQ3_OLDCO|nr:OLC1v1036262C1 [Oldenlandia corymbosa var. corymbosa]